MVELNALDYIIIYNKWMCVFIQMQDEDAGRLQSLHLPSSVDGCPQQCTSFMAAIRNQFCQGVGLGKWSVSGSEFVFQSFVPLLSE